MELRKLNKRGADPESIMYVIVTLVVIGIIIFVMNTLFSKIYDETGDYLNESSSYNESAAYETLLDIQTSENSSWDYGFLMIFMGYFIVLGFTAFATRINIFFFWFYIIFALIGLFIATILSNTWQQFATNVAFAETLPRFPIMNTLLGSYFPTVVSGFIALLMILLFGKTSTGGER